jgi:hypothetical protein
MSTWFVMTNQSEKNVFFSGCLTVEDELLGYPEMLVTIHLSKLCNIPEE